MNWMRRWPGAFPVFVDHAQGARFTDVDGNEYVDLCLGDTGAMTGHAPPPTLAALAAQAPRGLTMMLPTEDAVGVGDELSERFGLPIWQLALSATDANRFACGWRGSRPGGRRSSSSTGATTARSTRRSSRSIGDGKVMPRPGNTGPPVDPRETTVVVEFNDVEALERALATEEVACVLAEPALTNIGIVLPDDRFHDAAAARSPVGPGRC